MSLPALELRSPLSAAYDHCEALTRRASSNFYWGFRLLSHERRRALCAVYAFCRAADDIADEPGAARDPERLHARWRAELDAVYAGRPRHPIGVALADTIEHFPIEREHFEAVITGVETDLRRDRYETWDGDLAMAHAPMSVTLVLDDEIDISRGDTITGSDDSGLAAQGSGRQRG